MATFTSEVFVLGSRGRSRQAAFKGQLSKVRQLLQGWGFSAKIRQADVTFSFKMIQYPSPLKTPIFFARSCCVFLFLLVFGSCCVFLFLLVFGCWLLLLLVVGCCLFVCCCLFVLVWFGLVWFGLLVCLLACLFVCLFGKPDMMSVSWGSIGRNSGSSFVGSMGPLGQEGCGGMERPFLHLFFASGFFKALDTTKKHG